MQTSPILFVFNPSSPLPPSLFHLSSTKYQHEMPSEFPLFHLPMLIMKRILKLVTPFELVAISLCSKKSKMICKSTRSQLQCYKSTREFVLKFSSNNEIRLKFDYYPKTEWVFKISTPPRRNFLQKFLSMFPKNEQKSPKPGYIEVPILNWVPMENESISEMSIQLFTSQEGQTATMYTFILHLSDVFNVPLLTIELHFQEFTRVENEDIIEFYCRNRGTERAVESLRLVGKRLNTPEDDKVVDSILCRQEARYKLQLLLEPTPEFKFNPIYMQRNPIYFEAHHSHWIIFEQILKCKSSIIRLSNSILNKTHFKWFIESWNDGWIPPWKMIITDYCEDIDIDECFDSLRLMERFETATPTTIAIEEARTPPTRGSGMVERRAPILVRSPRTMRKRPAITIVHLDATRVTPITPMFSV
ncbi:hypothetical protein GCK72_017608 [Caenorhabditis remanei]|uniref:F-box domain-containing protein n=1 Tax=Caenorhabditis remanei TaxID=31234 RepID=A0A6A5G896_CAERE|nr:hypothetical protein GCK72_017608 [Caenorhabditis remanei]KAF1751056.1 hypothetical protein GCK72_017608 [Caenorhabditis remanei]